MFGREFLLFNDVFEEETVSFKRFKGGGLVLLSTIEAASVMSEIVARRARFRGNIAMEAWIFLTR